MNIIEREVRIDLTARGRNFSVYLTDASKEYKASCKMTNLSRSGMFLQIDENIQLGKELQFNIHTPEGTPIRGRLHVCWNREEPNGPFLPRGVGVKVIEFFEETQAHWFHIIEENLTNVVLTDLLAKDLVAVRGEDTCESVLRKMVAHKQPVAIVCDGEKRPIGLFSEENYLGHIVDGSLMGEKVAKFMTKKFELIDVKEDVNTAFSILKNREITSIPVVDEGSLVGLITLNSILPYWWEAAFLKEKRLKSHLRSTIDLIAHDLRNPVAIIQTSVSLLQSGIMDPQEFISDGIPEIIDHNCNSLLSLIDDLISEGSDKVKSEFCKQTIDMAELLERITSYYQPKAQKKKISLEFNKNDINIWVYADPRRMEQVMSNLISNAIKYSHSGDSVHVKVGKKDTQAVIDVVDSGQGIVKEELPFIFDKYCKISSKTTAGEPSTGLGLSIAKRLIEAHDGVIEVQSERGEGSHFTVKLPLRGGETPPLGQMFN